ncbi:hypothetical protein [Chelativorans xinjiangense]|uniref:hypothetical protein n=1 Tax=Chelativorans xinjiangense TaxID=2681485 RepID=UPI0013571DBA|nr:hypothetical protein [Chelativorans xinjiangense]
MSANRMPLHVIRASQAALIMRLLRQHDRRKDAFKTFEEEWNRLAEAEQAQLERVLEEGNP